MKLVFGLLLMDLDINVRAKLIQIMWKNYEDTKRNIKKILKKMCNTMFFIEGRRKTSEQGPKNTNAKMKN